MKAQLYLFFFLLVVIHKIEAQTNTGFLVWFKSEEASNVFRASHRADIEKLKRLSVHHHIWSIDFNSNFNADILYVDSGIALFQKNHQIELRNKVPNDPEFSKQYYLQNTGQKGGTIGSDVNVTPAWEYYTGGVTYRNDTIVVAIIDAGCDIEHEDLKENIYINRGEIPNDSIDNDSNGYIDDYNGYHVVNNNGNLTKRNHGTEIAGVIGAKGNNKLGISGVNWNVKLLNIEANTSDEAGVVAAYLYVYDLRKKYNETNGQQGAFIVSTNSSFGISQVTPKDLPIWCAMYDTLGSVGVVSVGATINYRLDIATFGDIPSMCASNFLIITTNTNRKDQLIDAAYSSLFVDLSAPGTEVYTTEPNNFYGEASGTSFSAPQVAAAISLLYSVPCRNFSELYKQWPDSAALLAINYIYNGVDKIDSLKGKATTEGRLNVSRSIDLLLNGQCNKLSVEPEFDAFKFSAYPNPADAYMFVELYDLEINECVLIDLTGKVVSRPSLTVHQGSLKIETKELPDGIYILKLNDFVKKIVVLH